MKNVEEHKKTQKKLCNITYEVDIEIYKVFLIIYLSYSFRYFRST